MSILYIGLISFAVGCVLGWICGVHAASGKRTQLRRDVSDLLRDVRTLKADAAKVQVCAEENALEQRRLRTAAETARQEAVKAATVIRDIKPTLQLIRTHNRHVVSVGVVD
jgi:hypothetical protein